LIPKQNQNNTKSTKKTFEKK